MYASALMTKSKPERMPANCEIPYARFATASVPYGRAAMKNDIAASIQPEHQ